jgi:capsular exopolysaccharide synthesis family protein
MTSALPGEGKTTTAANLALVLAERGLSVLLVDADMRRARIHKAFDIPRSPGLVDVLDGTRTFEQACHPVLVGDNRVLTVLTAGKPSSSPPALLGSHRMGVMFGHLKQSYDLIIVDSPPVNILTDAALLGRHADGVLLVVRTGVTDSAALGYAIAQLNHVRAPAVGVVLNDIDVKRDAAYDYAYHYASAASYMESAKEG